MKLIFFNTLSFEESAFRCNLIDFPLVTINFCKETLNATTAVLTDGYDGVISQLVIGY